jgi:hypothetical protein
MEESSISIPQMSYYLQNQYEEDMKDYLNTYKKYYNLMLKEQPAAVKHINEDIRKCLIVIDGLADKGVENNLVQFAKDDLGEIVKAAKKGKPVKVIENTENAKLEGTPFKTNAPLLFEMGELKPSVLCIEPYVGLNYDLFRLDGVKAVLHGTYHTESVCVDRSRGVGDVTDFSIIKLSDKCRDNGVDLFLAPCSATAFCYESTGDALSNGARPIAEQDFKTAYVKLLAGHALGLYGDRLQEFVNTDINCEKL